MIEIAIIFLIWSWMKGIVKKYWPVVIIPIVALTIVVLVVSTYAKGNVQLQQSDILSFSGNYLAFLGTFCLGHFIYIQDKGIKGMFVSVHAPDGGRESLWILK